MPVVTSLYSGLDILGGRRGGRFGMHRGSSVGRQILTLGCGLSRDGILLGLKDRNDIGQGNLGAILALGVMGQHNLDLDAKYTCQGPRRVHD